MYKRQGSYFDEIITMPQLKNALPKSDFIVSILPSTSETKGLLKYSHFEIMKKEAMFMNIGRGDLMKEETIHEVLKNQIIGHMVLDVFPNEPLNKNSDLWSYSSLTVTPHISSISKNYLPRAFTIFERNLQRFISHTNDEYVNKIDIRKGY